MNIEIHDAVLEARIQKHLQATGSGSVEEVLLRLLETQEEQDRWLLENWKIINGKTGAASNNSTAAKESRKINWRLTWRIWKSQTQASVRFVLRHRLRSISSKSGVTAKNRPASGNRAEGRLEFAQNPLRAVPANV